MFRRVSVSCKPRCNFTVQYFQVLGLAQRTCSELKQQSTSIYITPSIMLPSIIIVPSEHSSLEAIPNTFLGRSGTSCKKQTGGPLTDKKTGKRSNNVTTPLFQKGYVYFIHFMYFCPPWPRFGIIIAINLHSNYVSRTWNY